LTIASVQKLTPGAVAHSAQIAFHCTTQRQHVAYNFGHRTLNVWRKFSCMQCSEIDARKYTYWILLWSKNYNFFI